MSERHRSRRPIEASGPLTVKEAWSIVLDAVLRVAPDYRLILITSGEDINSEGRSRVWEFGLHFPGHLVQGIFGIEPCDMEESESALCLVTELSVLSGLDQAEHYLPQEFKDSPQAVTELAQGGADWISGSTSMNLQTRLLSDGSAVWWTSSYDRRFQTPFQ